MLSTEFRRIPSGGAYFLYESQDHLMDHIPMNPRLWNLYVARAKAKFAGHYPSPGASHWVHEEYVKAGGRFVATDHADHETVRVSKEKYAKISHEGKKADKGK